METLKQFFLNQWPCLLAILAGLYFYVFTIIGIDFQFFPGDMGDGRFNNYVFEHDYKFFCGKIALYWDGPFMYPVKENITFSDNLLGSAPIYALFRVAGSNRETAFQLWFMVVSILNFITCYLYFLKIFKNKFAATLGAYVFAFSLALYSQIGHAQTLPRFAIPLIFLFALLFVSTWRPMYFALALFALVFQFYCGIYLGFLVSFPLFIYLIFNFFYLFKHIKFYLYRKMWWLQMAVYSFVNFVLLYELMQPYARRATEFIYQYDDIKNSIPTFTSHLFSHPISVCWKMFSNIGESIPSFWDHWIFAGGLPTLALIILVFSFPYLFKKTNRYSAPSSIFLPLYATGIITFILFLRINNDSLYSYLILIPGFGSMRSITRIINIELLFFGLAVGALFLMMMQKFRWSQPLIFVGVLALLILDFSVDKNQVHHTEKEMAQARVNLLASKFEKTPLNAIISYQPDSFDREIFVLHIDAMMAGQQTNRKVVNGYSGLTPGKYAAYYYSPNEATLQTWCNESQINKEDITIVK